MDIVLIAVIILHSRVGNEHEERPSLVGVRLDKLLTKRYENNAGEVIDFNLELDLFVGGKVEQAN